MFRLEGVIIRLFVEPYRRYIKYSAHFGIPKKFTFEDTGENYYSFVVLMYYIV